MRLGRNLARSLFDYYKVTGLIPPAVCSVLNLGASQDGQKSDGRPTSRSRSKSKLKHKKGKNKKRSSPKKEESLINSKDQGSKPNKTVLEIPELRRNDSDTDSSRSPSYDAYVTPGYSSEDSRRDLRHIRPTTPRTCRPQKSKESQLRDSKGYSQDEPAKHAKCSQFIKMAYRTFDFKDLAELNSGVPGGSMSRTSEWLKTHANRVHNRVKRSRKVGGGGMMSRKKEIVGRPVLKQQAKLTETDGASLTIIDFNKLIRTDMKRAREHKGWPERGYRNLTSRTRNPNGQRGNRRKKRCRRRVLLGRGTVTDYSAWSETSSDSGESTLSAPAFCKLVIFR